MKPVRWLFLLLMISAVIVPTTPALADWLAIDTVIEQQPQVTEGDHIKIVVSIWNNSESDIEGQLRLLLTANTTDFPGPVNALIAGETGSNPTWYYELSTLQAEIMEGGEVAYVEILFDKSKLTDDQQENLQSHYNLTTELNDQSVLAEIFRKKISKTPESWSGEAQIGVMEIYVQAMNTQGQKYIRDLAGELVVCCEDGQISDECVSCASKAADEFAKVKPLVVTYIQEMEDAQFDNAPCYDENGDGIPEGNPRYAHDIFAAISLDDGLTWKRSNISRTAGKSSYEVDDTCGGKIEYPGDSESQNLIIEGPYAMVTWVDKYCQSGNPWDLTEAQDIYQVTGSQKSVDYLDVKGDEDPRPDLGIRPFSCLWAARGVLDLNGESPEYGTIVWYKAEQLSVGRRDAIRNFTASVRPLYDTNANPITGTGGFAVAWQEDPKGLKTGKGRGPGAGMSGASVNHKTDIWYSQIAWADFSAIDPNFDPSSDGDSSDPDGDADGNTEYHCPNCSYVYDPELGDPDNAIEPGTKFVDLPEGWTCPLDGTTPAADFVKDAKPHPLHHFSAPVPLTDNAVCRERIPEPVMGHQHTAEFIADCDYYYEGGTNNEPLLWADLPPGWQCPKCGRTKDTFEETAVLIKYRNEGGPYCDQFAGNPRVDQDGNYTIPGSNAATVAFYTMPGVWQDAEGQMLGASPTAATIDADGKAWIDRTRVYWSGEPLDGNTGASRPNLSLVNDGGRTIAILAYEETKGVGTGSDKVASAMEQKAPLPLVEMDDGTYEAGFTNGDCQSCHYQNVVPRDRVIPVDNEAACISKGGIWKGGTLEAYYPYTGYPLITEEPLPTLPEGVSINNPLTGTPHLVPCVKYEGGRGMYPRDMDHTDPNAYYDLPDHMPGWHQAALDCTNCHLPYNTKDNDKDGVIDRVDLCLDTPADEIGTVDTNSNSPTFGCSDSQDPLSADNNKDEPDRYRHGKNIYYHHYPLAAPPTIGHGDQINKENQYGWSEQGDIYENARRVRVVPNQLPDADLKLGLLYKEGKDGQGAPADAILRLFHGCYDVSCMGEPINLSSSTPLWFQNPDDAGNEDGTGDNQAGDGTGDLIGGHQTPHIEYFYWTDDNLKDPSGYWLEENEEKSWEADGFTPRVRANPFENVFSTRLAIRGDTVVTGFAHCANWSAGKKAKDHYDFYVRVSKDSGNSWTLPINVSQLKNHEESVSDCRIMLTPETIDQPYPAESGTPADISMNGAPEVADAGDFHNPYTLFVAVGTKENIPQPNPSDDETEENEVFLDLFYSKATIVGSTGGEAGDLALEFETYSKENPQYAAGSLPYLERDGVTDTDEPFDSNGIPNQPNPAYPEFIEEFDWMAKGDANQGDVQIVSNPQGTRLFTIWEQDIPMYSDDGQKHFQGADVWFRKVSYPDPAAAVNGDVNGDGVLGWDDGTLLKQKIGTTAYDPDFLWAADYVPDFRITGHDYNRWKVQFTEDLLKKQRTQWRSK